MSIFSSRKIIKNILESQQIIYVYVYGNVLGPICKLFAKTFKENASDSMKRGQN